MNFGRCTPGVSIAIVLAVSCSPWPVAWAEGVASEAAAANAASAGAATAGGEAAAALEREFLALPLLSMEEAPRKDDASVPVERSIGDEVVFEVTGIPAAVDVRPAPGAQTFLDQGASVRILEAGDPLRVAIAPLRQDAPTLEPMVFTDAEGRQLGRTDPLRLPRVKSAITQGDEKAQEAVPPRAPVHVGFPAWLIAVLMLATLALFYAIVRGLIRLRERWKAGRPSVVEAPVLIGTPDSIALQELALLEAKRYPDAGQFKPHYFGISEILKKYFGARYEFDALEATSHELVVELERRGVAGDGVVDRLERTFERLDRVKFTDHLPESDEPGRLLEEARDLVRRTRRELEAPALLPSPSSKGS